MGMYYEHTVNDQRWGTLHLYNTNTNTLFLRIKYKYISKYSFERKYKYNYDESVYLNRIESKIVYRVRKANMI